MKSKVVMLMVGKKVCGLSIGWLIMVVFDLFGRWSIF